tara:strand:- start:3211 stop:3378 length:168 start_codon:yes stop_codon:yes gene_type:complete
MNKISNEGTIKIIENNGKFQIKKMVKGLFIDIGKPYNNLSSAIKFRTGHLDLFDE